MSWIEGVGPPDLPDIFQVLSINPDALDTVKQLNEALSFGSSPLGRVREEAIATVVAVANRCRFGALTHAGFLRQYTGDQETAANMLVNHHLAGLDPADRQMLDFAVQATLKPSTLTRDDIESLRRVGFDDQEILSIILVTCLVNFMNRLADSLGIDIPPSYQKSVEKWLTGPAGRQPWLMRPVSQRTRQPDERPLAGGLGPNGWNASPNQRSQPHESRKESADSFFGDATVRDAGSTDLNGAAEEEFPDPRLDGAENGVDLGDLAQMLGGDDPASDHAASWDDLKLDALSEAITSGIFDETLTGTPNGAGKETADENDDPLIELETLEDTGADGAMIDEDEIDHSEADSESGTPPPSPGPAPGPPGNPGWQPPESSDSVKLNITPTSPDASGSETTLEVEPVVDEPDGEEEEDAVLVDRSNPVARFVGDTCVVKDGEVTSARDLYIAYLRWCDETIEPPMPQRGFGMILSDMGFNRRRRGRGRNWSWWGVGLGNGNTENVDDIGDEDEDLDADYSDDMEGEE